MFEILKNVYVCVCVCIYICVCVYIYIYTHTYIHTYIYTHILCLNDISQRIYMAVEIRYGLLIPFHLFSNLMAMGP